MIEKRRRCNGKCQPKKNQGTQANGPFKSTSKATDTVAKQETALSKQYFMFNISDGSGTEKLGFGRVREFPKFEKSGSGISGMKKVEFRRELKSRVSGIFGFYTWG